MTKKGEVISFAEQAKKIKEKRNNIKSNGNNDSQSPSGIAEDVLDRVQEESKRQKENIDIWLEELEFLEQDLESASDYLNYSMILNSKAVVALKAVITALDATDAVQKDAAMDFLDIFSKETVELVEFTNEKFKGVK